MMNIARSGHMFSNPSLRYPAHSDVPHLPAKKPMPTDGDTLATKRIFRPIPSHGRHTKDWTTIAWPTNIQSRTPDGKFGPAKMVNGWGDCWFMASVAAAANNPEGHKILAESIKKVHGGYHVTFAGSPITKVFIANVELQLLLEREGGDADTRIMELAADRFFQLRGNFQDLYIASLMNRGNNQSQAERCFRDYCRLFGVHDPMHFNPMRSGSNSPTAFFMLTGIYPAVLRHDPSTVMQIRDVMMFLNRYITNDRDGTSVVMKGSKNPLGDGRYSPNLVIMWDVIRTDITRDERLRKQERAFLNALDKWLATRDQNNLEALQSAARNLNLEHMNPAVFVNFLERNMLDMNQDHFNLLRSAVQEVLAGGPGYIGFPGSHYGTIERINEAADTFAYSEPNNPTVVHTGELSNLIQAIRSGTVWLAALEPTTGQDEAESSHAGEQRGRHLREIHHQVVGDGKIDPAESGPLANLMELDESAFRQVYDSDKNGVIEGDELKTVQLRVDRWVEHFRLSPIW